VLHVAHRWAIALIILLLEITLWVVLIGVPWGFGLNFKRPVCEPGAAEHWITPVYQTTYGGWKDDYDASALEVVVVVAHGLIAIAVPISEMVQRGGGRKGRRGRTGGGQVEGYTGVAVGSLRSAWWFAALAVGALVFYVGQAVAGFRFGIAWAEGIAMGKHDEAVVGTMLYDHVNAVLYMSLTVGLTLASIIGRWLLAGLSCTSFTIFLLWVGLTLGAFIPPFFVSSYWLFFKFEDSQVEFPRVCTRGAPSHLTTAISLLATGPERLPEHLRRLERLPLRAHRLRRARGHVHRRHRPHPCGRAGPHRHRPHRLLARRVPSAPPRVGQHAKVLGEFSGSSKPQVPDVGAGRARRGARSAPGHDVGSTDWLFQVHHAAFRRAGAAGGCVARDAGVCRRTSVGRGGGGGWKGRGAGGRGSTGWWWVCLGRCARNCNVSATTRFDTTNVTSLLRLTVNGSDTPTRLVGSGQVSSGPLGLQAVMCRKVTFNRLESRGT
jgi:hypothetical protein